MGPAWWWLLGAGILASVLHQSSPYYGYKSGGGPQPPNHQLPKLTPPYSKVTPTITSFALRLYKQLAADAQGNILFSPLSLTSSLALLSLGAQADTETQILEGLGFNLTETPAADIHQGFESLLRILALASPKLELQVSHSLFLDQRLKPQQRFLDSIKQLYRAFAFSADFAQPAATWKQINSFVRKRTYEQIPSCLQEFGQDTLMVLLNYIFFKAKWKQPFDPYQTRRKESFFPGERTAVHFSMVQQKEMHRFWYDQDMKCAVLQLQYIGNVMLMLVLPDPGKMQQVEATLGPETLRKWTQPFPPSLLYLRLPRLEVAGTYHLENILPYIGLGHIFSKDADLSGIMGPLNKTISRLSHTVVVEMNEKGARAGAVSGLLSQPPSLNMTAGPQVQLIRPVLLFLWEVATQSLLFMGKVVDPTAGLPKERPGAVFSP